MSRSPLLIDEFMRAPLSPAHYIQSKTQIDIKARLRTAHRFVFDDKAIVRIAEVIRDIPELLFNESQFARAPYDVTYIEIPNFKLFWETIMQESADEDADEKLGFLIDHNSVYVITSDNVLGVSYLLQTPWSDEDRKEFADKANVSLIEVDAFCWGHTFKPTNEELKNLHYSGKYSIIRQSHSCRWLTSITNPSALQTLLKGSVGELRTIIAILLLLNRPSLTTYVQDVPHARAFLKGKSVTYFSHTVVTIDIDPKPILRKIGTPDGDGISRRRHETRGTWCHNYDAREFKKIGCVHVWKPDSNYKNDDPNDPDHWVCSVCEGKRWWRNQHHRGDAQKGFVMKDEYAVTTRSQEIRRMI